MKNAYPHPSLSIFVFSGLWLLTLSCAPVKKLKYVADATTNNSVKNDFFNDRSEKTIQPYDYLYIKIFSLDEKTNNIFNERNNSIDNELLSYSVDDAGNITLPFIGIVNVKDMTINSAREKIEKSFGQYLNNVSVIVRFVSNKVTILGEVQNPGQHAFFDEKISIFQALGFAGGSSDFGNLSNVTLIREKDDVIKYFTLDLTRKNIASSEFYYLLPNDIVIINPIPAKYRALKDYPLNITAVTLTSISALLSIILIANSF
jgi:polysaccharide export outer membrane protein